MKQLFKVVDLETKSTVDFFDYKPESKKLRDKKNNDDGVKWAKKSDKNKPEDYIFRFVIARGKDHWKGETYGRSLTEAE